MEENQYAHMNKYIDQKPMILNWEADTFVLAIAGISGAFLSSGVFIYISFIAGVGLAYYNEKLKNTKYKNYMTHVLYMNGIVKPKSKRLPQSYSRIFLR